MQDSKFNPKLKQSDPPKRPLCPELKELVGFYPVCFIGKSLIGL
jgi:hypothetical protein